MNTEPSTPSCTQQNSPSMPIQQLTAINTDLHHLAAATQPSPMVSYGLTQSHIDSAVTLPLGTSMNGAMAFKSATAYHSAQPFSPPMDFASMNIASGYPTPVSATPVSVPHPQQQQQKAEHDSTKPATKSNSVAAKASVSPAATSVAGTSTGEKPEFSYASLIAQSLLNAPMQRRTLNGIYEWIQERFPYYRSRQNWQVSLSKCCISCLYWPPGWPKILVVGGVWERKFLILLSNIAFKKCSCMPSRHQEAKKKENGFAVCSCIWSAGGPSLFLCAPNKSHWLGLKRDMQSAYVWQFIQPAVPTFSASLSASFGFRFVCNRANISNMYCHVLYLFSLAFDMYYSLSYMLFFSFVEFYQTQSLS